MHTIDQLIEQLRNEHNCIVVAFTPDEISRLTGLKGDELEDFIVNRAEDIEDQLTEVGQTILES